MHNIEFILLFCILLFGYCISFTQLNNKEKRYRHNVNTNLNSYLSDSFNVYNQERLKTVYDSRNIEAQKLYTKSLQKNSKIIPRYYNSLYAFD